MTRIPLPESGELSIPVESLVTVVDQRIYDIYWKRVSVGPIMPLMSHASNVDVIGAARLVEPGTHLTHPPPDFYAPHAYTSRSYVDVPPSQGERYVAANTVGGGVMRRFLGDESIPRSSYAHLSHVSISALFKF